MAHVRFSYVLLVLLTLLALVLVVLVWNDTQQVNVVIEWSTASELDTVGFNLYRSESLDGGLEKINDQLIPATSDAFMGGSYQFTDATTRPGRTYYYWLEDVDASGIINRNGPIEAQAGSGVLLEWLLVVILMGTIVWGWGSLLRSRVGIATQTSL